MPTISKALSEELAKLIDDGDTLSFREKFSKLDSAARTKLKNQLQTANTKQRPAQDSASETSDDSGKSAAKNGTSSDALSEKAATQKLKKLTAPVDFRREYQIWYSKALRIVEQLLPDRYEEFRDLYKIVRRKGVDVTNYGVADYLAGITVSRLGDEVFSSFDVAMNKFSQQIHIVRSVEARLASQLADVQAVLQATILDDEITSARSLLRANHVRSAGVIAGVVMEAHLKVVLANHSVSLRKMSTLGNLNDALRAAEVYDVPTWRQLQYVSDLRNLCAHKSQRDPRFDEIESTVDVVDQLIHSVF